MERGGGMSKKGHKRPTYSQKIRDQAVRLHDEGFSHAEIARQLGVAGRTVTRWAGPALVTKRIDDDVRRELQLPPPVGSSQKRLL